MKWYKHLVDSGDDPDIDGSAIRFGSDGPWVFFRTLEIMSREFDITKPGENLFEWAFYLKKFRISARKLREILNFFDKKGRIKCRYTQIDGIDHISLKCPKLKYLCDEYTRKRLSKMSGVNQERVSHVEVEVRSKNITLKSNETFTLNYLKSPEFRDGNEKEIYRGISRVSDLLIENSIFPNVHGFINTYDIDGNNPKAILHALIRCFVKQIKENPYGYCRKVLEKENRNYNELDFIRNQKGA